MSIEQLEEIALQLVAPGKGIIAIDESNATIKKRFDALKIECSEDNRRAYRELLLTTPNLASARSLEGVLLSCQPYLLSQYNLQNSGGQHYREYTPHEVRDSLVAAGFTVVALETDDVWAKSNPAILNLLRQLNFATDLRGDNIFALARKTGAPVERYPEWLYTGGARLTGNVEQTF